MEEKVGRPEGGKFFADTMLGRLATWMRALGFDVSYERKIEDPEIVRRAEKEGRIILTRDTLLTRRRGVRNRCLFIEGDRFPEQLREVLRSFKPRPELFLTRCLRCNTLLDDAEKTAVEGLVPPYVYETQERFSVCPVCRRIYWAGTHRARMLEKISAILKDALN